MKETRLQMGMPITVEIIGGATQEAIEAVFAYFVYVDETFSTYKPTSEISRINNGDITETDYSADMKAIFALAEKTKQETNGYFDIWRRDGTRDPSGIVKGWAIDRAARMLHDKGFRHYYVEAGGDIQVAGKNAEGKDWKIGIRNPFNQDEIIKTVYGKNNGIATSGTYIRGQHIYNPHDTHDRPINDIVSLTVIGPNIYEADRFATAAFAMGKEGIKFIEAQEGLEGYMINCDGIATYTSNFDRYTA